MKAKGNQTSGKILATIVVAQFCGTSLWFAGNAALPLLQFANDWPNSAFALVTSSTLIGFIGGTLLFALTGVTDKYPPANVFLFSCVAGSVSNALALIAVSSFDLNLISRCATGFFLAGIYPVGMKIAADWKAEGLGAWLGALVGALVLGTSLPHGLRALPINVDPTLLLVTVSALSLVGGVALFMFVGDGPYRKIGGKFHWRGLRENFRVPGFRSASLGYFGHMWELYALWAFLPWLLRKLHFSQESLLAFSIVAVGGVACAVGGAISQRVGSTRIATVALAISGTCCALSPLLWLLPHAAVVTILLLWGASVVADSPQFSALVAKHALPEYRGSAITLVTCIGFSITIVSIQLLAFLDPLVESRYVLLFLLPGPIFGLLAMSQNRPKPKISAM